MGRWGDWEAIEASQAEAARLDAERRAARAATRSEPPKVDAEVTPDPEAVAAVAEAASIVWPHPIPPRLGGPHPTYPDGTPRIGSWRGGGPNQPSIWEDRPPSEALSVIDGIRAWARDLQNQIKNRS